MTRFTPLLHTVLHFAGTLLTLLVDVVRFLRLCLRPSAVLAAENLFLRKQLALYQERHVNPRRATRCHPPRPGLARALVRLASGLGRGAPRDLSPLASAGIPALLALEIHTWTPADPCGPASPHPPHGAGEPVVG